MGVLGSWNLWAEDEGGGIWRKDTCGEGEKILWACATFMVVYITHKYGQDDSGVPPGAVARMDHNTVGDRLIELGPVYVSASTMIPS